MSPAGSSLSPGAALEVKSSHSKTSALVSVSYLLEDWVAFSFSLSGSFLLGGLGGWVVQVVEKFDRPAGGTGSELVEAGLACLLFRVPCSSLI